MLFYYIFTLIIFRFFEHCFSFYIIFLTLGIIILRRRLFRDLYFLLYHYRLFIYNFFIMIIAGIKTIFDSIIRVISPLHVSEDIRSRFTEGVFEIISICGILHSFIQPSTTALAIDSFAFLLSKFILFLSIFLLTYLDVVKLLCGIYTKTIIIEVVFDKWITKICR